MTTIFKNKLVHSRFILSPEIIRDLFRYYEGRIMPDEDPFKIKIFSSKDLNSRIISEMIHGFLRITGKNTVSIQELSARKIKKLVEENFNDYYFIIFVYKSKDSDSLETYPIKIEHIVKLDDGTEITK